MLVREAIAHLDGHAIITPETADAVCQVLGVPLYSRLLIMTWRSSRDAMEKYRFMTINDGPGSGVDGLDLSYHVAEALGVGRPGACFSGVGIQARINQQAIRRKMSELGKL